MPLAAYFVEIGSLSDVGLIRANNQDSIGFARFVDSRNILAVVADGMGGHRGGEVASQKAVETFQQKFSSLLSDKDFPQVLRDSFIDANSIVYQLSLEHAGLGGMGSTLVALAVFDGYAYYANTGDSRLYLFRDGNCTQLSEDHTVVAEMLKGGLITAEDAENHPDKHIITCAIGTRPVINQIAVSSKPLAVKIGDCFLLCSDGLYDVVKEHDIMEIIVNNSPQEACRLLVDFANAQGGFDNISVIIAKIVEKQKVFKSPPITKV